MRRFHVVATWPQSSAPAAPPPMNAIWTAASPRPRTQAGSASCAVTLSDAATEIQAIPLSTIAAPRTTTFSDAANATAAAVCMRIPAMIMPSRDRRLRQIWIVSASTTAPKPKRPKSSA